MIRTPGPAAGARALIFVLGLTGIFTGCAGTTGHLAAATTRSADPRELCSQAPPRHVKGRDCIDLIVIFPTRMPNFGIAIDNALQQSGGRVLTDVRIGYEIRYFPFVYGQACYVAEGDAR